MRRGLLGITCVCVIVACNDDTTLSIGTADLTFEGSGTETVAWAIAHPVVTGYAGWSMYFSTTGSAASSCNSDAFDAEVDLWVGGSATSAPAPLPAGEYHVTTVECGSAVLCASMTFDELSIEWSEIELIESTAEHQRGSMMGSALDGSNNEVTFYGSFDAEACN